MGCFDGGSEIEGPFETFEQANEYGYEFTKNCGPWDWEVLDESPSNG